MQRRPIDNCEVRRVRLSNDVVYAEAVAGSETCKKSMTAMKKKSQ